MVLTLTSVVPAKIMGRDLLAASRFRSSARIPVLVWKHPSKGTTITRCKYKAFFFHTNFFLRLNR